MQSSISRTPLVPSKEDTDLSKEIVRIAHESRHMTLILESRSKAGAAKSFELTPRVARLVLEGLSRLARGSGVRVLEVPEELSTFEAAELLNVSRTHLIGMLDRGAIPFRFVGSHRRIALGELLAYKDKTEGRQKEALDAIAAQAQELKLYE